MTGSRNTDALKFYTNIITIVLSFLSLELTLHAPILVVNSYFWLRKVVLFLFITIVFSLLESTLKLKFVIYRHLRVNQTLR